MLSLDEARTLVLAEVRPAAVSVPLNDAAGLVLAAQIVSPQFSPLFDNSAMDGFAVQNMDQKHCTVIGTIAAGDVWNGDLGSDQALRIMTGAQVPAAAAAVVPIEQVRVDHDGARIEILAPVKAGQHIRRQGEEFKPGDLLLSAGMALNPASIGLLASVGLDRVPVYRVPRVGILATGSELLPVASALEPGKLRDSNSPTLAACVREAGAEPVLYGILPDQPEQIRAGLIRAFAECDLVLTSGGVSVGDFDYVQEILLDLGMKRIFWKVAIKPGKPVLFGTLDAKLLFGIPGNPASALTVFELLVRPALRAMQGHQNIYRPEISAVLTAEVRAAKDRLQLLRLIHEPATDSFTPLKGQSSSNLLAVARANALMAVDRDYAAGERVRAWRIE